MFERNVWCRPEGAGLPLWPSTNFWRLAVFVLLDLYIHFYERKHLSRNRIRGNGIKVKPPSYILFYHSSTSWPLCTSFCRSNAVLAIALHNLLRVNWIVYMQRRTGQIARRTKRWWSVRTRCIAVRPKICLNKIIINLLYK